MPMTAQYLIAGGKFLNFDLLYHETRRKPFCQNEANSMKLFVLYKIVFDCISLTVSKVRQAIFG